MNAQKSLIRAILAALFLSTGAALITYILFNISLGIALSFAFLVISSLLAVYLYRLDATGRKQFLKTLLTAAIIGLMATAAYDISRVFVVWFFGWELSPFKAFKFFGEAIAGENTNPQTAFIVGAIYHVINGVFFSISYCLLLGGRHWVFGILWALGLEVLMFSIYPTWLNLDAVIKEFTVVSVSGHIVFGAVLGVLARRLKTKLN
ncbi:MAG TPA: hypothetical protein PKY82_02720 [Pyrinomonadaceae bacterium]|nr:hypothetical protein [Pyrinomonadaceae bacterium]